MNNKIYFVLISLVLFSACSTAYKSGQTPDDVYYSPKQAVVAKQQQEVTYSDFEEREIRMQAYDPRWRTLGEYYDYDYRYSPYSYGYNYGYYYNPYYYNSPVYITGVSITNPKNSTPRMTNLGSYNNTNTQVVNVKSGTTVIANSYRQYNNSNSTNSRRVLSAPTSPTYTPANSGSNNRTYNPSPSSSGRSSGTPVQRNSRGH